MVGKKWRVKGKKEEKEGKEGKRRGREKRENGKRDAQEQQVSVAAAMPFTRSLPQLTRRLVHSEPSVHLAGPSPPAEEGGGL